MRSSYAAPHTVSDEDPDTDCTESLLQAADTASDPATRARLQQEAVLRSLPLAESVARRYYGRGIDLDDLVQVARMALVKAVRRYRPGAGAGFTVYAVPTISGEIKRYFRDSGWSVRPPRRLQELRVALVEHEERLLHDLRREPTLGDLAEAMSLPRTTVGEARLTSAAYRALSLDAPVPGSEARAELPDPADAFDALETHDALRRALAQLTDRERQIVHLRFVDECTQAQIGAALGVSQMQVSRLLVGILRKLRDRLTEEEGEDEVGMPAAGVSA
ncbi:MAG TPA: sigma-70 family RNA polymerase sigma factor [Intrasporangium sp.]|uniref:sigma-70 family RNA polymerase sigma factor n=1 Tax=Intrasporangium sp. TaxID=1925024 RepID=UPI002D772C24|nr:sigma-70 family RNA polymerase sigma factor [Intrasporangium sp.]HET7398041.1 sigma-70 family RNA polymerase sigma factor [Intrasporangium sp.]